MKYKIEVLTTRQQMDQLRDEWEHLERETIHRDFYLTFEWFYAVVSLGQALPGELRIFTIRSGEQIQAVVPCILVKKKLRFSKVRSLELLGNIYSPKRAAVVLAGQEDKLSRCFFQFLNGKYSNEWDIIDFLDLSPHDQFVAGFFEKAQEAGLRPVRQNLFSNLVTDWSSVSSANEFCSLLSKNMRQNIRTSINKHNRNGKIALWLVQDPKQDISTAVTSYYDVYQKSWKKTESDPEFHGQLARKLIAYQKLRLFFLYYQSNQGTADNCRKSAVSSLNSEYFSTSKKPPEDFYPIAALYCIVHNQIAYSMKVCYDQKYSDLSPGTALHWFAMKHLIDVDKCSRFDHQKGNEAYKFKWIGQPVEVRFRLRTVNPFALTARLEFWFTALLKQLYHKQPKYRDRELIS